MCPPPRCFARWASRRAACRAGPTSRWRSALRLVLALLAIWFAGDRRIAVDLRRRDAVLPSSCCAASAPGAVACAQQPARALDRAAAGHRQHPPARRADAVGGAVARPRPDACWSRLALIDGNLRRQIDRQPAGARAELLLRRYPGQRRSTRFAALIGQQAPDGKLVARADAARPRHGAQRRRRRQGQGAARGRLGAARRPRPDLCGDHAGKRHASPQAHWWPTDYAGEPLVSFSAEEAERARPEARRHPHRQRARPQRDGAGSPISARSNGRSMGINFVMVFSPNTFAGAPHSWLATLTEPDGTAAATRPRSSTR